jgi:hypothetical protein
MFGTAYFSICPRCGTKAFENFNEHSHCIECLYFEDRYRDPLNALENIHEAEKYLNNLNQQKSKKENLKEESIIPILPVGNVKIKKLNAVSQSKQLAEEAS